MRVKHEFDPIYNENSVILILGSLPSVKSRDQNFYYGHPRNRFWQIIAKICNSPVPMTISGKTDLCLDNRIALWDVIESCDITGSSDSSIKNVRLNDLSIIFEKSDIKKIFLNGSAAYRFYKTGDFKDYPDAVRLPSTSPANASYSFERLLGEWSIINEYM